MTAEPELRFKEDRAADHWVYFARSGTVQGPIAKEHFSPVLAWCIEQFGLPDSHSRQLGEKPDGWNFFMWGITFANPNQAMMFKMRWC